jgi:hypothetical protein
MSKWREDVSAMKSRRVHRDLKMKILLATSKDEHQVSGE